MRRSPFESAWRFFGRRVDYYGAPLLDVALETELTYGRPAAIRLVERFAAGTTPVSKAGQLEDWRRDRAAACAYRTLEEPAGAARSLKRSVMAHFCRQGSCLAVTGALADVYLELGRPLDALLACTKFTLGVGPLPIELLSPLVASRLVDALVSHHRRDAVVDTQAIRALARGVASQDESVRRQAWGALWERGPTVSASLFDATRSFASELQAPIDDLLVRWALYREGDRFWASADA